MKKLFILSVFLFVVFSLKGEGNINGNTRIKLDIAKPIPAEKNAEKELKEDLKQKNPGKLRPGMEKLHIPPLISMRFAPSSTKHLQAVTASSSVAPPSS